MISYIIFEKTIMGGLGSGTGFRFNTHRTKAFVQERKSISSQIFKYKTMQKIPAHGVSITLCGIPILVKPNHFEIQHDINQKSLTLQIQLTLSKTHYGNARYWMKCPHCQRQCGKLYLCNFLDKLPLFLCRICLNLAYKSQNKTALDRMIDKKWAIIHKRLKSESSGFWDKPKGMHWRTFNNVVEEAENLDADITIEIARKYCQLSI